jgi:hypothetical protein
MSTDLYGVRVLEVDPDASRLRLRVFVVYYDTQYEYHQPVPDDRSFFVRILCDRDALGDDIDSESRFDEKYIDSNAFRFVDRFEELERRNFPVESYESLADFYYERSGGWENEEQLVQADYDVFVTRSEYLAPFEVGDSWGTTSYQTDSDALTLEDYPHVPDFHDLVRNFEPFSDWEQEETVVSRMSFSHDGSKLLVVNGEGGFRIYDTSTSEWPLLFEEPPMNNYLAEPGWTHDGRIAYSAGLDFIALNFETKEHEEFAPFGASSSSDGKRFLSRQYDGTHLQLFDERGEELFALELPQESMVWADFDNSGQRGVIAVENTRMFALDLDADTIKNLEHDRINALSVSPDGRYVLTSDYHSTFKVIRIEDDLVVRQWRVQNEIPTAVAWSPAGDIVATSYTQTNGLNSRVFIHRTGQKIDADAAKPLEVPKTESQGVEGVVRLYCERTALFDAGWSSHVDDDLIDFHVALAANGSDLDLLSYMRADDTRMMARAYEAVAAHRRGEKERAEEALSDAEFRVAEADEGGNERQYGHTFVYAPLAQAQFLLGYEEAANESLEIARTNVEDEANPFQKRAVLGRALLAMGRLDEVRELIDSEREGWFGDFHQRLLAELADAGAFDLFAYACHVWDIDDDWSAPEHIQNILLNAGEYLRVIDLSWLGEEVDLDQDIDVTLRAWEMWFANAPEEALERFEQMFAAERTDPILLTIACQRDPSLAAANFGTLMSDYRTRVHGVVALYRAGKKELAKEQYMEFDEDDRCAFFKELYKLDGEEGVKACEIHPRKHHVRAVWLGYQGVWEDVYEQISKAKPTKRAPFYQAILQPALERGETSIVLESLAALPCNDMNSFGLRALQSTLERLLSPHLRQLHP